MRRLEISRLLGSSDPQNYLRTYVNDHLAGAVSGSSIARRAAENATDPELARTWNAVASEIEEDRKMLEEIRSRLGLKPNPVKQITSQIGEKALALKTGLGPDSGTLGQMMELEMLVIGITGKLALWHALEQLNQPGLDGVNLQRLIERAESQRARLEEARIKLVPAALGGV